MPFPLFPKPAFLQEHRHDPGDPGSSPEGCVTSTPAPLEAQNPPPEFAVVIPMGPPHCPLPQHLCPLLTAGLVSAEPWKGKEDQAATRDGGEGGRVFEA